MYTHIEALTDSVCNGYQLVVQNLERQKKTRKQKTKVLETTQFSSVTNRAKVLGPHKHRAHRPGKKTPFKSLINKIWTVRPLHRVQVQSIRTVLTVFQLGTQMSVNHL